MILILAAGNAPFLMRCRVVTVPKKYQVFTASGSMKNE